MVILKIRYSAQPKNKKKTKKTSRESFRQSGPVTVDNVYGLLCNGSAVHFSSVKKNDGMRSRDFKHTQQIRLFC